MSSCYQDGRKCFNERRRASRFPFVADAEITSTGTAAKLVTRVTDLSLYGCYVDAVNPLPPKSEIFIRISTLTEAFETQAMVVYSLPNLGMGLVFHEVKPHFLPVLRKWLTEASKNAAESDNIAAA